MDDSSGIPRPALVTAAVVLVYIGGLANTGLGILVLLARYDVPDDAVVVVSLVGAATILLGLLTVAGGSSLARGSRLARGLLTAYLSALVVLQGLALTLTDRDLAVALPLAAAVFVVVALWLPPSSRYFRAARAPSLDTAAI